jgi:hypothetical protein
VEKFEGTKPLIEASYHFWSAAVIPKRYEVKMLEFI